jgi:hypothetical protein
MAAVRARLVAATHDAASTGALLVASNAPSAHGELADGVVSIDLRDGAKIRSTAPHSAAVEVGSRPHMPPVAPLVAWVKLRGMQGLERGSKGAPRAVARMLRAHEQVAVEGREIRSGPNKGSIRFARSRYMAVDAAEKVAWMIAMAIKKRGTKPTWFVRRSLPGIRAVLGACVRDQLSRPL